MTVKAIVTEDIKAYSLISLRGAREDDPDNIYLQANLKDRNPDLYATKDLKEGDEVFINIEGRPVWQVRLSNDVRPGAMISAEDNGEARMTSPLLHKQYLGFTIEGGKAGDVVKYVRKTGVLEQTLDGDLEGLIDDEEV